MIFRSFRQAFAVAALLSAAALPACAPMDKYEQGVGKTTAEADSLLDNYREPSLTSTKAGHVRKMGTVWLGSSSFVIHRGAPLPPSLSNVTLRTGSSMDLRSIGSLIAGAYGVPVSIDEEAIERAGKAGMALDYKGSGKDLLDQIASNFGISWTFEDNEVRFYLFETRTFNLIASPSTATGRSELASGTSGSGDTNNTRTSASATAKADTQYRLDFWKEIIPAVETLVGDQGSVVASPAMGTITVRTTAPIMGRVSSYIREQNDQMGQQVSISAVIYAVNVTRSDDYAFDLSGFLTRGFGNVQFNPITSGIEGAATLVGTITNPDSQFNNSQARLRAVSGEGYVSIRNTGSVTTMNGQPAPMNVVDTINYVPKVAVTTNGDSVSSQIETESLTFGFVMNLLPRVMNDDKVLLEATIQLSELNDIRTFTSNDSTVQLPDITTRALSLRSFIDAGETLVVAGFEGEANRLSNEGIGDPRLIFPSGSTSGEKGRTLFVITLTPKIERKHQVADFRSR